MYPIGIYVMASDIPLFLYHPMLACKFTVLGYMNQKVPKVYVDTFLKLLTRKVVNRRFSAFLKTRIDMKINSTELSLSLALHSVEQTVLPDATSEAARGAIANIRLTLIDMLKRQGPAIPFLQECINEGEDLCCQIHRLLGSVPENLPTAATEQSFDALIKIHEKLTEKIQNLSGQLLEVKVFNPHVGVTLRKAAQWGRKYYVGMSKLTPLPFGEDPPTTPPTAPPLTADFLRNFLRSQREDNSVEVIDFRSIPGGYGNQTFFCTLSYNTDQGVENEEIVVRKSDGMPIVLPLEQEYVWVDL
jgi:hypothetical protein